MSAKQQHNNILLAVAGFTITVLIVGLIGFFTLDKTDDTIQGEVEVSEYRVASKLPGRIVELRAKEGDYVHAGDTLAILEVPEMSAQERAAQATGEAAEAVSELTDKGSRKQQIDAAWQLYQQALTAQDVTKKTYTRLQHLFDEGVTSAQKRDEAYAAYKAAEAQARASKSHWEMLRDGSRAEEKKAAAKQAQAAKSAVDVVRGILRETVQVAQVDGEVTDVYPKVGELVGIGSPIMTISMMGDMWGTFNVREDQLKGLKVGDTFRAYSPAFGKEFPMKVYSIKDEGSYATWKATKTTGQYDLKTFEVKARPTGRHDGLRPGMSLIVQK